MSWVVKEVERARGKRKWRREGGRRCNIGDEGKYSFRLKLMPKERPRASTYIPMAALRFLLSLQRSSSNFLVETWSGTSTSSQLKHYARKVSQTRTTKVPLLVTPNWSPSRFGLSTAYLFSHEMLGQSLRTHWPLRLGGSCIFEECWRIRTLREYCWHWERYNWVAAQKQKT